MSRDGKFDFFYIQEFVSYIQSFTLSLIIALEIN